ncbi:hypothetical protein EYB25_006256 [Talaromyces marneffei]|nr:hypothetical protein EYB25_006256 [Talaromyces marneffei]
MDTKSSPGSAKRRRLGLSVNSLLNPTSPTGRNPDPISHYRIAQPVLQEKILDTVQVPDIRTGAVYPKLNSNSHPSRHHSELPWLWSDHNTILSDGTLGVNPAVLYDHALGTDSALQSQCQLNREEIPLSTPNPPNEYRPVGDSGSGIEDNTVICYGMVAGIPGECEVPTGRDQASLSPRFAVELKVAQEFLCPSIANLRGSVTIEHGKLLQAILDETSIRIQVTCVLDDLDNRARKPAGLLPQLISCSLSINLYGPKELFEEIGTFFQDYDIYLQDPVDCDLNVRYCNPHRLSSTDPLLCPMTHDLQTNILEAFEIKPNSPHSELLDILDPQEDLSEASQPPEIHTQLERHQKQALSFMLRREQGWNFDSSSGDLWDWKKTSRGRSFINMISGDHQLEEPKQFFGGIIADPMGLGKTLTMIALVAATVQGHRTENFRLEASPDDIENKNPTLIVVPPLLLDTWEEQLSQHVVPGSLAWSRHYGRTRLLDVFELKKLDLILTTYHTISAEWKNRKPADQSILFSTPWERLILDEAHFIRNSSSQMAKAICAVPATARWAVTGTPIQNRLGDLAALFKFLDVDPYGDIKRFDTDITQLWKSGESKQAVERLKRLSRYFILRRPKTTINLPTRKDVRCPVNFTPDERILYEDVKNQAIAHLAEASKSFGRRETSQSITFVNVIQQINTLRIICNLGVHYGSRHDNKAPKYQIDPSEAVDWASIAQRTFNFQCEITSITCQWCKSLLDITERLFSESSNQFVESPLFSQCLIFICPDCRQRLHGDSLSCGHEPPHPFAAVSLNASMLEETVHVPANPVVGGNMATTGLPSKVASLVRQLKAQPSDVKSVVFSTWRMSLDVVESGLKQAQIPCLRFDGKVPQKERKSVIDKFKHDPSVSVLLLTLSCGAVGLTLTEASCAYLMEPHWNPTVEEQALARIHRLGQKKEVTTVRFYIKDTFEERVMELQRSKDELAGTLFSSENAQSGNSTRLERLCGLL